MVEEITKKEDELCGFAPYLTHSRPGWGLSLSRGGISAITPARVPPLCASEKEGLTPAEAQDQSGRH